MRILGEILRTYAKSKQKTAHFGSATIDSCCDSENACNRDFADGCSSKHSDATCQHRYPSPCRSAQFQVRPADGVFLSAKSRPFAAFACFTALALSGDFADSSGRAHIWKGTIPCLRLLGSLRLPLSSACRPAWTTTQSAHLLALAPVALLAKFWTTIAPRAPLWVALPVHLPTTSKTPAAAFAASDTLYLMNAAEAGLRRRLLV